MTKLVSKHFMNILSYVFWIVLCSITFKYAII